MMKIENVNIKIYIEFWGYLRNGIFNLNYVDKENQNEWNTVIYIIKRDLRI